MNSACATAEEEQAARNYYTEENNKLAQIAFENGLLNKTLRERVINGKLNTLDEATIYAMEQDIRINENNQVQQQTVRCNYCNIIGHKEFECRRKANNRNPSRSPPQKTFQQNTRQEVKCYNCNQFGHYARDCRNRGNNNQQMNQRYNEQRNETGNNSHREQRQYRENREQHQSNNYNRYREQNDRRNEPRNNVRALENENLQNNNEENSNAENTLGNIINSLKAMSHQGN